MASAVPAARFEDATIAPGSSRRHQRSDDGRHAEKNVSPKLFDFTFHAPTQQEKQLIQVSLFSVALAVVIITLGFAIGKVILGFF